MARQQMRGVVRATHRYILHRIVDTSTLCASYGNVVRSRTHGLTPTLLHYTWQALPGSSRLHGCCSSMGQLFTRKPHLEGHHYTMHPALDTLLSYGSYWSTVRTWGHRMMTTILRCT